MLGFLWRGRVCWRQNSCYLYYRPVLCKLEKFAEITRLRQKVSSKESGKRRKNSCLKNSSRKRHSQFHILRVKKIFICKTRMDYRKGMVRKWESMNKNLRQVPKLKEFQQKVKEGIGAIQETTKWFWTVNSCGIDVCKNSFIRPYIFFPLIYQRSCIQLAIMPFHP